MILNTEPSTYIEKYKNALTKDECENIISYFENQPFHSNGKIGGKYDETKKSCLELPDLKFSNQKYEFISNIIWKALIGCLEKYKKKYPEIDTLYYWNPADLYNIQKYSTENDGYKIWHCEHGPFDRMSRRILVWMFYLNNAKSGTEFLRYPKVKFQLGDCLIWPASWTHMHKGETPNQGIKYIATGWVEYNKI